MDVTKKTLEHIIEINRGRIGLDPADVAEDRRFSTASGADTRLCVYGRMRPDGPDAHALEPLAGTWSECSFPGYLQAGAQCTLDDCPGLAWTLSQAWNDGCLLTSGSLETAWDVLDAKEGGDYARLLTPVRIGGAESIANIYVSRDATEAQLLMLDGMNVHDDVDFKL
ncbi:hypothetical protein L2D14_11440 [Thalassospiraceae bacterium LMO-JJ14]|nr:hypothetical protein L2D14_11440 [Thalassospiraceae bacterium LMO-JJ14]